MKKILLLLLTVAAAVACIFSLSACKEFGKDIVEGSKYDYALVSFPNGETKRVELKAYDMTLIDQGRIHIYGIDGKGYIVSEKNCLLVNDPKLNIDAGSNWASTKIYYDKVIVRSADGTVFEIDKGGKTALEDFDYLKTLDGTYYYTSTENYIVCFTYEQ